MEGAIGVMGQLMDEINLCCVGKSPFQADIFDLTFDDKLNVLADLIRFILYLESNC